MNKRDIAIASVKNSVADGGENFLLYERIVDNLIRDGVIALGYAGTPDISMIIDFFQMKFGTTATVRTDRFAAQRLAKRHGAGEVCEAILALGTRKKEKFAPVVNNITQLEQKWPAVIKFISSSETTKFDT